MNRPATATRRNDKTGRFPLLPVARAHCSNNPSAESVFLCLCVCLLFFFCCFVCLLPSADSLRSSERCFVLFVSSLCLAVVSKYVFNDTRALRAAEHHMECCCYGRTVLRFLRAVALHCCNNNNEPYPAKQYRKK